MPICLNDVTIDQTRDLRSTKLKLWQANQEGLHEKIWLYYTNYTGSSHGFTKKRAEFPPKRNWLLPLILLHPYVLTKFKIKTQHMSSSVLVSELHTEFYSVSSIRGKIYSFFLDRDSIPLTIAPCTFKHIAILAIATTTGPKWHIQITLEHSNIFFSLHEIFNERLSHVQMGLLGRLHSLRISHLIPHCPAMRNFRENLHKWIDLSKSNVTLDPELEIYSKRDQPWKIFLTQGNEMKFSSFWVIITNWNDIWMAMSDKSCCQYSIIWSSNFIKHEAQDRSCIPLISSRVTNEGCNSTAAWMSLHLASSTTTLAVEKTKFRISNKNKQGKNCFSLFSG